MLKKVIKTFIKEESGQSMIEYAILAAILVVALIVTINGLSGSVRKKFNNVSTELEKHN